jgi:murein DD-endopeptidase MepM/ murein hydrolase activator NlpD
MGAPAVVATALARTRAGRRAVAAASIAVGLLLGVVLAPIWVIPLALTSSTPSAATPQQAESAVGADGWIVPASGPFSTGRGFGWNPVEGCAFCPSDHKGYDLSVGCGAPIIAAAAGNVITAGPLPGWGNSVRIDHGDGIVTLYAHMQWHSLTVAEGEALAAGDVLGTEGSTGKSTGCHLHFELQVDGIPVDPEPFLASRGLSLR